MVPGILPEALQPEPGSAVVLTASEKCAIMTEHICRHGEIGRHKGLKIPRRKKRTGSSPVAGTITDTVNDTIVSFTVSFFYPILPLNMVVFQTLQRIFRQRIFSSVAKMLCICPFSGSMNPYILCFQFVKQPLFVIQPIAIKIAAQVCAA